MQKQLIMKYNIEVNPTNNSKLSELDFNNIPFGKVFSDHMFVADYYDGAWRDLRIEAYQPLSLTPATMVLHYAQTIFEGMKVLKSPDGIPLLFRPEMHAKRFNRSAHRMAMPDVPEDLFEQAIRELIQLDYKWIPDVPESALYIRPFMFGNDPYIGVRPSDRYQFIIFTAPVGSYYADPVKLLATSQYVRAVEGGTGFAKTGGNYAASLLPQKEARAAGFDQIMWLDAVEHKYIHECGTMNIFIIIDGKVITPATEEGTILEGITRDTFIHLLRASGYEVEIRPVSIDELIEAVDAGKVQDMFGSGTAAVVAPISHFHYKGTTYELPEVANRTISQQLKKDMNNIRSGKSEDLFNWVKPIALAIEQ